MQNSKSPRNDGLAKEFYGIFRDDLKETFLFSVKESSCIQKINLSMARGNKT